MYRSKIRVSVHILAHVILFGFRVNDLVSLLQYSMAIQGYKKPLEDKDLWSLNEDDRSEVIVQKLQKEWDKQKQEVQR